jgi:phenylacetate-CoA ligase
MMNSPLNDLVDYVRNHSPFFAELYGDLPTTDWQLTDLPLIDPIKYWRQSQSLADWPVLTGPVGQGHVFKTGGSTGEGKLSVFTREEWRAFTCGFSQGLAMQLQPGDRVANLFFAGDLYTSLLFIHDALAYSPIPVVEFPFTGQVVDGVLAQAIVDHHINVLAGVPVMLSRFARSLQQQGRQLLQVRCILYGGESVFPEQLQLFNEVFPHARIGSIGCASVDAGLIGAASPDCQPGEHRLFDADTVVEIIDEISGQPLTEPEQCGLLVVTNLRRHLMPIIRYPTGDLACWCEPQYQPQRKFMLQGRAGSSHRVRIGTLSLFPADIAGLLQQQVSGLLGWQLLLDRQAGADQLIVQVASKKPITWDCHSLRQTLLASQPLMAEQCQSGILQLKVMSCVLEDFLIHPRSGKLLQMVDLRNYHA